MKPRLTTAQFAALAKLTRMHADAPASRRAAELVLVNGLSQSAAATAADISLNGVKMAVRRCRAVLALAREVVLPDPHRPLAI